MIPLLKTEVVLAVVAVVGCDRVVAGFIISVDVDEVVGRAKVYGCIRWCTWDLPVVAIRC